MRRLYLHIYFALVCVLVLYALLLGGVFWHLDRDERQQRWIAPLTSLADASIPPSDAPAERLERWARALAEPLELDLTIYDAKGTSLVRVGDPVPRPPSEGGSRFLSRDDGHHDGEQGHDDDDHDHDHGLVALAMSDGRWIVARGDRPKRFGRPFLAAMLLLAVATGIAAYPVARRLTRRLETLKRHVDAFGEGSLALRVPVEGHDEIARLAHAFNATADRIQRLVDDKTRLLANTSHELRTPLARVRAALELMRDAPRLELIEQAEQDLRELDGLIGELLVASRLDAPERRLEREAVDCLALAAEEAARFSDVEVEGRACVAYGDPRLLRRAVRNLVENAIRHGAPPIRVEVGDAPGVGRLQLVVEDRGPGVPEAERERIFEPFYRPFGSSSARGGIGLGLALVRQIAERHGGRVVCEPRSGGGTRFVLELPAAG